ncbi:MAG TPA: leucine--tRNA ligase [Candidatus Paceibacterota bacterium]|jgi:leucyl-tRNA synthetase|nr:leucine--tRNA ligase [Candidatus Paceibacterota bacterium]
MATEETQGKPEERGQIVPDHRYDPKPIEAKWQKKWREDKVFAAHDDSPKPKYYQLETFPYPSAAGLHMGHPKGFTAEDIHARYMRMKGSEVLYTIGWDAFGLPTENYAIKVGKSPKEVAKENIENFRRQVQFFGFSYDWDREINTSSPEYYKWTQWLFIQLFKKNLAYQREAKVNWCPNDQTVLANEQVVDGKCERCGAEVEERDMVQWFLRITDYADRLLADLKGLDWPAATVKRQEDWIGRSLGTEIDFPLDLNYRYVLLHGYLGSREKHFFPWLRNELTRRGISFICPELPGPDDPKESEQVQFVLQNIQFNENTVLYGHSLGAVVALKVLEKLDHPIAGLVLSGGFLEPKFKDHPRPFENNFNWNFNFEKIKSNVGFIRTLSDLNDTSIPVEQGRLIHEKLDGRLYETVAQVPHFHGQEEPAVLETLLPMITVFTTRPDTIFGATYLVLAPEHNAIKAMWPRITNQMEVQHYIDTALKKTERMRQEEAREKTGVEIKGVMAINPTNQEAIPLWIADYVLIGYGTGAIMAVPAHDGRDLDFARKFHLPVRPVVSPKKDMPVYEVKDAYTGKGYLINSPKFNGMDSDAAKWEIEKLVGGRGREHFKLRDWSVSRQRYWGAPIPMIHCEKCGLVPVPDDQLPVLLPDDVDYRPKGKPPLASSPSFMNVKCPNCDGPATRDAETLDTFVDSSWYYLRYADPQNPNAIFDKEKARHWLPVDLYVIGAEHTVLHLLYARFITKFLHDEGYLAFTEPFLKLRHQGLLMGTDGQKMSKSKGNVVNPDEVVGKFGADVVRLDLMFMGPFEDAHPWDEKGIAGVERFVARVARYGDRVLGVPTGTTDAAIATRAAGVPHPPAGYAADGRGLLHKTIKKVGEDIDGFKFNTAISSLMILMNDLESGPPLPRSEFAMFVKIIHPFTPHLAQELWARLGNASYLDFEPWPQYDESLITERTITLVLQVNGKVRDAVTADATLTEDAAKALALANEKVKASLAGKTPQKVIYVDKKLVNIVA